MDLADGKWTQHTPLTPASDNQAGDFLDASFVAFAALDAGSVTIGGEDFQNRFLLVGKQGTSLIWRGLDLLNRDLRSSAGSSRFQVSMTLTEWSKLMTTQKRRLDASGLMLGRGDR